MARIGPGRPVPDLAAVLDVDGRAGDDAEEGHDAQEGNQEPILLAFGSRQPGSVTDGAEPAREGCIASEEDVLSVLAGFHVVGS